MISKRAAAEEGRRSKEKKIAGGKRRKPELKYRNSARAREQSGSTGTAEGPLQYSTVSGPTGGGMTILADDFLFENAFAA